MYLQLFAVTIAVMDQVSSIAEFPYSFKEYCTDILSCVAQYPSENQDRALLLFVTQRRWLVLRFKGPHF